MQMTQNKPTTEIINANIRTHLEQRGLAESQQVSLIEEVLGLSASQTYRKLNGSSQWQLGQLEKLAQYLGLPTSELLVSQDNRRPVRVPDADLIPAILHLTDHTEEAHCWIQLGDVVQDDSISPLLLARRQGDSWHVYPGSHDRCINGHEVTYLAVQPPKRANNKRLLVAVLDDMDADILAAVLVRQGLFALPYESPSELLAALPNEEFDAFVLDWVLGDDDCMKVIETIRQRSATVPIIVLTGHAEEYESALQQALRIQGVYYIGKPTPGSILALQITNVVTAAHDLEV
ncbi:hypothetical protein VI26_00645 [Chromobacterium sp. LK1]|nr:hypothetical protein VI26_00645 [Chromobacterium sp. LK1]